jgi:hypothetical protein
MCSKIATLTAGACVLEKSKSVLQGKQMTASRQGLPASEIARMVGLSVNEVSDLLESDGPSCSVGQAQLHSEVCSTLAHLREEALLTKAPVSHSKRPVRSQIALAQSIHALRSLVSSALLAAEQALGAGVEALPGLLQDALKEPQAAQAVKGVLKSLGTVQEAAQQAQNALGAPDPAL